MDDLLLFTKLKTLSESMKSQVADFIDFLISKSQKDYTNANNPKPEFGSGKGTFKINPGF